jgi:chromosome segregation ATPase
MTTANRATQSDEISDLRSRLDWMDEERRKLARRLAEIEQRMSNQERELESRDPRFQSVEERLAKTSLQLGRLSQVDNQIQLMKEDLVKQIEQTDLRRVQAFEELEKLRRVEQESARREISEIRKEITVLGRIQNDLELRRSEESRLAGLIGGLQNRLTAAENNAETWEPELRFLREAERAQVRTTTDLQASVLENQKRFEPIETRVEIASHNLVKLQTSIQAQSESMEELRNSVRMAQESVQMGEVERNQRLSSWRQDIENALEEMKRYAADWSKYDDLYKEARTALHAIAEWQKQMEMRQRESDELSRIEINRLQTQWDSFVLESEKRWKAQEADLDQRWAAVQRNELIVAEHLSRLDELIEALQEDKDTLMRVQAAQTDAMKMLPRVWQEEVEKAIAQNPHSRRQPAFVPVREE